MWIWTALSTCGLPGNAPAKSASTVKSGHSDSANRQLVLMTIEDVNFLSREVGSSLNLSWWLHRLQNTMSSFASQIIMRGSFGKDHFRSSAHQGELADEPSQSRSTRKQMNDNTRFCFTVFCLICRLCCHIPEAGPFGVLEEWEATFFLILTH